MASIRSQMEVLDAKMAEYQQTTCAAPEDIAPIDLDIDLETVPSHTVEPVEPEEFMIEQELDDDLPFGELAVEDVHVEELPVEDESEESVFNIVQNSVQEPARVTVAESVEPKTAVIDAMVSRHPWRTDMPGSAVKDIRSAISLNDRIIFINYLFNEDPMLFQDTLNKINQMASFDEAVGHVVSEHPEWDLNSEVVYRFMMAVRRRLR